MNTNIINVAISGALGRMGKLLIKEILKRNDVRCTIAIIKNKEKIHYSNIEEAIGKNKTNIPIVDSLYLQEKNFDVLIDFSTPNNTIKNIKFCAKNKKKIVIGTTGFNAEEKNCIKLFSKQTTIIQSSNFSTGINLIHNLLEIITKTIGKNSDIEIIESHHRNKIDAPSGTAIELAETISNSMHLEINKNIIYNRIGNIGIRPKNKIGFSSIRAGNIIGEHSIIFANDFEHITINHKAINRSLFVRGAIQAAIWSVSKENGLFTMKDVLKI